MRKILLLLMLTLILTGCTRSAGKYEANVEDGMHWMETLDKSGYFEVVRHRQTGVCYLITMGPTGRGITVMLNADGTPYTMH